MITRHLLNDSKEAPLYSASFLVWTYLFYNNRIEILRNFIFSRSTVIYVDKIELLATETDPILSHFGRCNLVLTFAGNIFTLFGLPKDILHRFADRYGKGEDGESVAIRLTNRDLLMKSILQNKLIWYVLLNILIWAAVFLVGSEYIDTQLTKSLSDFVLRRMLVAGTLVLSLGLPTVLIWLWAFTGGFLAQFVKYYRYTVTKRGDLLYFEYGLLIHRQVYLDSTRIAITEYRQSPLMQLFGYGKLNIRAIGHNPLFLRPKCILPFVRASQMPAVVAELFPSIEWKSHSPCKRSMRYDFIAWKSLLPFLCVSMAIFFGYGWLIAAAIVALFVAISVLLEYRNTDLQVQSPRGLSVSRGGFYRTTAWIDTARIEMISLSGSRRKLRKGFANTRVRVFGKSGTYALIRNIGIDYLKDQLGQSESFSSNRGAN